MPILTKPSSLPHVSLLYITLGILFVIWTGAWHWSGDPTVWGDSHYFWFSGLMLTGIALVAIGLLLGRIGRQARKAELPPSGGPTEAAMNAEQMAAARAPVIAPMNPGMPATPGAAPVLMPGQSVAGGTVPVMMTPAPPPVPLPSPTSRLG